MTDQRLRRLRRTLIITALVIVAWVGLAAALLHVPPISNAGGLLLAACFAYRDWSKKRVRQILGLASPDPDD